MKAAIDIGTNTVLLLVAEIRDGQIITLHEEQRVPRLGKGVDAGKNIDEAATNRVIQALKEYKNILSEKFPNIEDVIVTATSAVRDAQNRDDFMRKVKEETGFSITLLSGGEEAEWTAAGALSVLPDLSANEMLILDIGGGSTEVARILDGKVKDSYSFDMGSVRFTERFLAGNPPSKEEISNCTIEIKEYYQSRPFKIGTQVKAIGVAGTVTTLAGIALKLKKYEPEKLNGFDLTISSLQKVINLFEEHTHEEMLERNPVYLKGREDIFFAGMLILEGFLVHFGLEAIKVSVGGIRHGALTKTMK